ncbi:PREDICTED: AN1-type zinc finger protein 1-like isoform X2 [Amphimedon queenslandica]|uniref:AN1-type domain-containing protein n=1 Tax=Amphimedon queenslandica TaxID=400682 RepID=A0AAN0JE86_AMPQE|nr:PREDICTED: AN1-type zinc finger protein 1-like isoform X2 [Amphimedon queenslandica]|eukprot:XP_019855081.1 PREDICTED: AN1-type zinc finger protein 1-like isoform X2 [Amphimedon queenslandica]
MGVVVCTLSPTPRPLPMKMDIGSHCSVSSCRKLDFLPFVCDGCKKIFCSDHRSSETHNCISISTSSPAEVCGISKAPKLTVSCSLPHCHHTDSIVEVVCKDCGNVYCLNHRNPVEHNCSSLLIKSKPQSIHHSSSSSTSSSLFQRKPQGPASVTLSAKVALMKLKQKAMPLASTGIPDSEKVFYEITLPKEYGKKNYPVLLSKWKS